MAKVLANDGISEEGKRIIEAAGHEVSTDKIEQADLLTKLNDFDGIIVRSATQVTSEVIDASPNLKFIGRAGVGLDNIDVKYAEQKGVKVANTPAASSASVAELAMAHMYTLARFLQKSNQDMPQNGTSDFKVLKKAYSKGVELRGKTLGVIGAGRIGIETMKLGVGVGMNLLVHDLSPKEIKFKLGLSSKLVPNDVEVSLQTTDLDTVLSQSDFISLHVPSTGKYLISTAELAKMKKGAGLINCARGGVVDENALLESLNNGHLAYAGIDVFEKEPTNNEALLKHSQTSVTPHIGGSTTEAQDRIGSEMAQHVVDFFA